MEDPHPGPPAVDLTQAWTPSHKARHYNCSNPPFAKWLFAVTEIGIVCTSVYIVVSHHTSSCSNRELTQCSDIIITHLCVKYTNLCRSRKLTNCFITAMNITYYSVQRVLSRPVYSVGLYHAIQCSDDDITHITVTVTIQLSHITLFSVMMGHSHNVMLQSVVDTVELRHILMQWWCHETQHCHSHYIVVGTIHWFSQYTQLCHIHYPMQW